MGDICIINPSLQFLYHYYIENDAPELPHISQPIYAG